MWPRTPALLLTRRSSRKSITGWQSVSTGQRRGWRKSAAPSRSVRQNGKRSGGLFPAWKNWTARSRHLKRMTGTALWNTPRCTAGRTSVSLSRTGWRLRLESTNPPEPGEKRRRGIMSGKLEVIDQIEYLLYKSLLHIYFRSPP